MNHATMRPATSEPPTIEHTRGELLKFLIAQKEQENPVQSAASSEKHARRDVVRETGDEFKWTTLVASGLSSWWHNHPARAGATLVKSATEDFARHKPLQVVAVAAAVGAAVVLFKPWRLVSVTALALTLFRSSNFTGMAASVLETATKSMQPTPKRRP